MEVAKTPAVDSKDEEGGVSDKRLDRQQAYQHFHIGIYITLATAIVGASYFDDIGRQFSDGARIGLIASLFFLLLAGMCGGMVAARIPEAESHAVFESTPIGFSLPGVQRKWLPLKPALWESLEHFFFWIAIVILAVIGIGAVAASKVAC